MARRRKQPADPLAPKPKPKRKPKAAPAIEPGFRKVYMNGGGVRTPEPIGTNAPAQAEAPSAKGAWLESLRAAIRRERTHPDHFMRLSNSRGEMTDLGLVVEATNNLLDDADAFLEGGLCAPLLCPLCGARS